MKFFLHNKFYRTILGDQNDSGYDFQVTTLYAWSISNIIAKISPCGRAREAHWPRYQGLAVQAYSGTPAALPMNISNA
ncbi:MAG: hypothetical protein PVF97_01280 [Desulfobacterales bacterium]|jgi:hypothetical protein